MTRKRVLFIGAAWPPFKAPEADHISAECVHLAEVGVDVHVLTTAREQVVRPDGVEVHAIVERWSWRELPKVWRLVRELRPDGVLLFFLGYHFHYATMPLFLPLLVRLLPGDRRFVTQFPGMGKGAPDGPGVRFAIQRFVFRSLGRFRYGALLPLSDRILVMSPTFEQRIARIDRRLLAKTRIVPPAPLQPVVEDSPESRRAGRRRLGLGEDDLVFMYFSRLYPEKGIEMLLRAFRRVLDVLPAARLAMVGGFQSTETYWQPESYPAQLRRLEEDLELGDRVVWSGEYAWDSTEASEYLRAADVAILPFDRGVYQHNSSFGMVAAHAVPAIITEPRRGLEPGFVDGENVRAITPRGEDELVDAMVALAGDCEGRSRLRKGAQALADEWYSWDACVVALRESLGV